MIRGASLPELQWGFLRSTFSPNILSKYPTGVSQSRENSLATNSKKKDRVPHRTKAPKLPAPEQGNQAQDNSTRIVLIKLRAYLRYFAKEVCDWTKGIHLPNRQRAQHFSDPSIIQSCEPPPPCRTDSRFPPRRPRHPIEALAGAPVAITSAKTRPPLQPGRLPPPRRASPRSAPRQSPILGAPSCAA